MVSKKKLLIVGALASLCLGGCSVEPQKSSGSLWPKDYIDHPTRSAQENSFANLVGEDALGRKLERVGELKKDKKLVGVFYSAWLGQHNDAQKASYNITTLESTTEGKAALEDLTPGNPKSPVGEFHFWGEPLYGYYNMRDPWVVARHVELFIQAGIDYLCIDTTNNVVYKEAITNILDTLLKFQNQGFTVPKVVFYTNSFSGTTVDVIYNAFYTTTKWNSLWMSFSGDKPSIIGITHNNNGASDQTRFYPEFDSYIADKYLQFFDIKESEWPNGLHNDDSIPWMSWEYPQRKHNGTVAVPVAQHAHDLIYVSSKKPECHRGYNNAIQAVDSDWKEGKSFQQMWDTALGDPEINNALCTSFNEWMAIKQNDGTFVDVYDEVYSRDMEMMKGGYGDNYVLQLARNARKFKYEAFKPYKKSFTSINVEKGISPLWDIVDDVYADLTGEVAARDFIGATAEQYYRDASNRNDIKTVKVASDKKNIYFYVECLENITERDPSDPTFMNILLRSGNVESGKDFAGFNYVINRSKKSGNAVSIEKCTGGYAFEEVGEALCTIEGKVMQVSIPRDLIGVNAYNDVEFKITDHITHPDDIMDYYVSGESFPLGRLRYAY